MLISEPYREQQRRLHQTGNYGVAHRGAAAIVCDVIRQTSPATLLDYGAGSGGLKDEIEKIMPLTAQYVPYDPAFPEYGDAVPADMVACIDVLEHVEPDCLDLVLDHLQALTLHHGLFTVHTGPAMKILDDGRNAHLIQRNTSWWLMRLAPRFLICNVVPGENGFAVLVEPGGADV